MAAVGLEPLEVIENMQLTHYTKFLKRTNRSIGTSGVRGVYTALRKVSTEVEFSSLGLGRRSVSIVLAGFVTRLATVYGEHDDRALRFSRRCPHLEVGYRRRGIRISAETYIQQDTEQQMVVVEPT